jgi:hypothetical protein
LTKMVNRQKNASLEPYKYIQWVVIIMRKYNDESYDVIGVYSNYVRK